MSDYKRFVSYIYGYEQGEKRENTGFVKVNARGDECKIWVHVKGFYSHRQRPYRVYVFTQKRERLELQASSLGGGRIMVNKLDGIDVNFTGESPTLIVHNLDQPGHVAEVTSMLSHKSVNIATMQLYRNKRGGDAVMVLETDQPMPEDSVAWLAHLEGVIKVTYLNTVQEDEHGV